MLKTYVFFDIETTGLPWQEKNRTKIIELSFVAVTRMDLECTDFGNIPPVNKLTLVFNPQMTIHPKVTAMTGLSSNILKHAPTFKQKAKTINIFLEELSKPVCLVAHNGNNFDYKILLAESNEAGVCLPQDLLCADSLLGFKKLLKGTTITYNNLKPATEAHELLTDDEDDWPDFNVSTEEWHEIDTLCLSLSDISCDNLEGDGQTNCLQTKTQTSNEKTEVISNIFKKNTVNNKACFSLSALYKRLLNKEEINVHRAEVDCLMLLQCVVALKNDFLSWLDQSNKPLSSIMPLKRY